MLGLKLRDEFLGQQMPGTAISLCTSDKQGAVQKSPEHILSITYPTADVEDALKAIAENRSGRPIILMGDRGRGKSHIMAVMHHAIQSPDVVEKWSHDWGKKVGSSELESFRATRGFVAISEPVHNHEYPLLWNLLFDRHPKGEYYRGQFESLAQSFPPRALLEKMFEDQPTCLILDEFQTWFTGLPDKDPKTGFLLRQWAFNFLQNLSDIAKTAGAYAQERFRLLHTDRSEAEKQHIQGEVFDFWPFSPALHDLLEEHILLSAAAQDTRDLIRILAQVYRTRGDFVPVITPADFYVDGKSGEVQTLIDSIAVQAGQERLIQIAQNNLQTLRHAGIDAPNAREIISAIWMRSMSPGKRAGGTPAELHLDITRQQAVDDNAFQAELTLVIENSVNIHGHEVPGGPLWFRLTENPRSKVRACAKNAKLWQGGAVVTAGQVVYPGKDISHIRNTLRHVFVSETAQPPSKVVVLGPNWSTDPWSEVDEADRPEKWDRPVLIVIPEQIEGGQAGINACLGSWLAKHIQKRRNTGRFLLPSAEAGGLYSDDELTYSARCSYLCSKEAWGADSRYSSLHNDFDRPLRKSLRSRFDRFAVLKKWDFRQPKNCTFEIEKVSKEAADIPASVEARILSDLFDKMDFKAFVLKRAKDSEVIGSLMDDLIEPPPPNTGDAIPYLGETKTYEFIIDIAAEGEIVLNVGGAWIGRRPEDASEDEARIYIRSKAFRSGQEMRQVQLGLPGAVGGGTVTAAKTSVGVAVTPPQPTGATAITQPQLVPTGTGTPDTLTPLGASGAEQVLPPTAVIPQIRKSDEPATSLNLSGCFEKWGVPSSQILDAAHIEFNGLTAQQVKQILQRIPSNYKALLEITYREGADQ